MERWDDPIYIKWSKSVIILLFHLYAWKSILFFVLTSQFLLGGEKLYRKIRNWTGWKDLHLLWQQKSMRLSLFGVLIIPLVYSFIYLWAFYDPYENVKYLPVAFVNEDQGAIHDGEKINIGNELVKELETNNKVKWEFVTRAQMDQGFRDGKYFLGIVVPSDFSQRVMTVDSKQPLSSQLEYYYDEGSNYLTGKIGASMIRSLEQEIDQKLTREFVVQIFDNIEKSTKDLEKAVDGSRKLSKYTGEAEKGSRKIYNGSARLQDGAEKLYQGNQALVNGIGDLRNGLLQLQDAIQQLAAGANQIDTQLQPKIQQILTIQSKVHEINNRIQQISKEPNSSLDGYLSKLQDARARLNVAKQKKKEEERALQQLLQKHPELKDDPAVKQLRESIQQSSLEQTNAEKNLEELKNKWNDLVQTVQHIKNWRQTIADTSQQITNAVDEQVAQLVKLGEGVHKLSTGLNLVEQNMHKLVAGVDKLYAGNNKLVQNYPKLINGIGELKEGAGELQNGLSKIQDGQNELANKLSEGVDKTKDSLQGKENKEDIISDPVHVREHNKHKISNYASGFAPYFISLSLWVGGMILFTILDLFHFSDRLNRPVSFLTIALIGFLQAIICTFALTEGLGIDVQLNTWLYPFPMLMSLCFLLINQLLVVYLKNVGRFLAIVILMFQLASSGGTYPTQLLPDLFQEIAPYLPMTYTVHGLRAILSNGDINGLLFDVKVLLFIVVICYLLIHAKTWLTKLKWKKNSQLLLNS